MSSQLEPYRGESSTQWDFGFRSAIETPPWDAELMIDRVSSTFEDCNIPPVLCFMACPPLAAYGLGTLDGRTDFNLRSFQTRQDHAGKSSAAIRTVEGRTP
jgi:hypothetical protein